jgi:hypothetical protein
MKRPTNQTPTGKCRKLTKQQQQHDDYKEFINQWQMEYWND